MRNDAMNAYNKKYSEAVLLLAHGTPDVLEEMKPYLELVTGGRKVSSELVHEMQECYAQIGLTDQPSAKGPHLTRWTHRVAALLQARLSEPVYVGMRNWKPFIGDVVEQMQRDGVQRVQVVCLAPQNSRTSVGLFRRAVETAAPGSMEIDFMPRWSDHPLLIEAFEERLRAALRSTSPERDGRVAVLFTAHSVPARTVQPSETSAEYHGMIFSAFPDTYERDCRETASLVAAEVEDILSPDDAYFSFQSQGMSGGSWIGPTVEETLADLKKRGYGAVVVQPIGFLCDHVEILYDIDVAFQRLARGLDLKLIRTESLNDSSLLIDALEDLVVNKESYAMEAAE